MLRSIVFGLLLVSVSVESRIARADLIHEAFAYPAGSSLVQQNGGTGFAGGWASGGFNAIRTDFIVDGSSLSYPGLSSSGGSVSTISGTTINGISRAIPSDFFSGSNIKFMSFLIRRDSTAGGFGGFGGIYLSGSAGDIFIGKPGTSNVWSMENRGGGGLVQSNYTATVGETSLLVVRMRFQNGADGFDLYVDPSLGGNPVSPSIRKVDLDVGQLTNLVLYTAGDYTFDEIRFGDTFASVTAVPEPSSLALAFIPLFGLASISAYRRRAKLGREQEPAMKNLT